MKNYFTHLLSWKGQSSRLELLGIFILCFVGLPSLSVTCLLLVHLILGLLLDAQVGKLFTSLLGILSVICILYLSSAAVVRRLRHIGISPYWAFGLLILLFIPIKLIGVLVGLFLVLCPPFRNPVPAPYMPTYFVRHLVSSVLMFLIPMLIIMGLAVSTRKYQSVVGKFIPQKKLAEIRQERETQQEQTDQLHQKALENLIPPGTNASDVVPYEGQEKPAVSVNISQPPLSDRGVPVVWSWPVPDTIPAAEQIDWDTQHILPCTSIAKCKFIQSKSKDAWLQVRYQPETKVWTQKLVQSGVGTKEEILFSSNRMPVAFYRYKNKKRVQVFKIMPNATTWFRDISLDSHPAFGNSTGEMWFQVNKDGSFVPIRFLDTTNPNTNREVWPEDHFNTPWPGIHPSTQFLDLIFPVQ